LIALEISKPRWFNPAGFFVAMKPYEIRETGLLISDDRRLLDRVLIHRFLSENSYWAKGVPREVVDRSIEHSLCFGVYQGGRQTGFARVVTDFSTFAWLADVFVVEEQRGQGLSKRLVAAALGHPQLQGLRRFLLGTADAHGLYARFGFAPLKQVERFMEIHRPNPYNCG
jgi:GNAT superfamily N-acetyltransferase